jgi:hypothetical protein
MWESLQALRFRRGRRSVTWNALLPYAAALGFIVTALCHVAWPRAATAEIWDKLVAKPALIAVKQHSAQMAMPLSQLWITS